MSVIRWSEAERAGIVLKAVQIFQDPAWSNNYFEAVKLAMQKVLPEDRHRKLLGTWSVYWAHPALPSVTHRSKETLEACEDMHFKKSTAGVNVEKLVEFFSIEHAGITNYRKWRMATSPRTTCTSCGSEHPVHDMTLAQQARFCRACCAKAGDVYPSELEAEVEKLDEGNVEFYEDEDGNAKEDSVAQSVEPATPVQMEEVVEDGVEYMVCTVKIPKPAASSDVGEAIAKLTALAEESKAIALGNKLLLEALPHRISSALNPLSLNIVNLIDAVRALSDATGTVGNLEVPAAPPVQSTVKAKKPSILVVGLLPQQAQEIRSSFGEVFDLRFIESHVSNVEQLIRNTDQIYGNTKFMKHSLDAVLRKVGADRYTRFSGSTSKLKVLLRRQNSSYLGLEM